VIKIGFNLFVIASFVLVTLSQNKDDQHLLFTQILKDYVHNGLVNYKKLKDDKRLNEYLKQLENTNPDNLITENDKLAFWIKAASLCHCLLLCSTFRDKQGVRVVWPN